MKHAKAATSLKRTPLWIAPDPEHISSSTIPIPSPASSPPSNYRQLIKPPVVTREMLNVISALHVSDDEEPDNVYRYNPYPQLQYPLRWPPVVTRLPEARIFPSSYKNRGDICSSLPSGCRFLLPLYIGEQESKARIHFLQLLMLTERLNRTLILPDVSKSHLGGCVKKPFEWYYDLKDLRRQIDKTGLRISVLEMGKFKRWLNSQYTPVQQGRIISLDPSPPRSATVVYSDELVQAVTISQPSSVYDEHKLSWCAATKFRKVNFDAHVPLHISPHSVDQERDANIGGSIGDVLLQWGDIEAVDVLAINWDLRRKIFLPVTSSRDQLDEGAVYGPEPRPDLQLSYSTELHDLATQITPSEAYLAVHWRMETVEDLLLPQCAQLLLDKLREILLPRRPWSGFFSGGQQSTATSRTDIKTVWFASDYPLSSTSLPQGVDAPLKSTTFRVFSMWHEEAVSMIRHAFASDGEFARHGITLTGLDEQLDRLKSAVSEDTAFLLEDSGAQGILDKLVAIGADVFVAGNTSCARKSSFTRQIETARKQRMTTAGAGEELLVSAVEWFGESAET